MTRFPRSALELLGQHYGRTGGVLTASGSAAIEVALRYLGVRQGDEVIVPHMGCYKIGAAVVRELAVPVFAHVGESLVLDPATVGAALSPRTRCIVAVHQYGLPCPIRAIRAILPEGVGVVEDAAQSWGTVGEGREVGRDGDLLVTSFGRSKPVPLGTGGAVLSDDPAVTELVSSDSPGHRLLGMPPTPAPFPQPLMRALKRRLLKADAITARRRDLVARLTPMFDGQGFRLPKLRVGDRPSWHRLPVWCSTTYDRDRLLVAAARAGLPARREHKIPLDELPMFLHRHRTTRPKGRLIHDRPYLVLLAVDGSPQRAPDLMRSLAGTRTTV